MKSPLLKAVEQVDGQIAELRQDAGEKWNKLEAAKTKVAEATAAGEDLTPDHDAVKALDEAGAEYGSVADQLAAKEAVKSGFIAQMGREGITTEPEAAKAGELGDAVAAALGLAGLGRQPSAGERITGGETYAELKASGALSRSRVGEHHLGEGLNRDQLKAALITGASDAGAGAFVTPDRKGYYPLPFRPLTFLDLITIGDTDSDLVEYVRMLTLTNAAAEVAEATSTAPIGDGTGGTATAVAGGLKPESGMTFEIVQEAVATLAHWVPATRRALSDAGQLRTIIDGALRWGLGDRLERQSIAGNGVGENLLGILNQPGINSVPAGAASHADKVRKAMTAIRLDGFEPTGVLLNPADAETIQLSRENAGGDGAYLFGSPNNPGPLTLWGLPIAQSAACPEGTAVVGAFMAFILWLREGTQVLASDSHMDFFTRNLVAILAEMRAAAGLPTPQAIADVDLAAA